jgi:2TM domain
MELRSTPLMADRVYSKEEADAILARAIELQGRGEATSYAELAATAREIGVAPEALEKAAAEVLARRHDDQALRALRASQWRGFFAHLVPYVCVGVLLGFINVMTGGFPWAVIPMLAWGVGLASHLLAVAVPDAEKLRWRVARQRERASQHLAALSLGAHAYGPDPSGGRVRVEAGDGEDRASDASAFHAEDEGQGDVEQPHERSVRRG